MARTSDHYILILCGGTGPRLWPLSRVDSPKQFLNIFGTKSLLQDTLSRFRTFVPPKNIYIVSNKKYLRELKRQIGNSIPLSNIIAEPEKKNTTMAVIYGLAIIKNINPNAVITVAPSDHHISKLASFKKDILLAAFLASNTDTIITLGIKPTNPNPSYGYILTNSKSNNQYPVTKFIEKPSIIDAQIYIKKNAYWNSGIYTFHVNTLSTELAKHQKGFYRLLEKLQTNLARPRIVEKIFSLAENISIDKAVSEKSDKLSLIPVSFQWNDVGEWQSIFNELSHDKNNNALIGKTTNYLSYNSKDCLISSPKNKLVGLVGINNLAVIDTPDSLLICDLNDSFSVRNLVSLIVSNPHFKYHFLSRHDK
jgi:mannose-1-phosphate guanylyltransferase